MLDDGPASDCRTVAIGASVKIERKSEVFFADQAGQRDVLVLKTGREVHRGVLDEVDAASCSTAVLHPTRTGLLVVVALVAKADEEVLVRDLDRAPHVS